MVPDRDLEIALRKSASGVLPTGGNPFRMVSAEAFIVAGSSTRVLSKDDILIESILANLPGMAVNPFSLFFGIRDTAAAHKRNQDNGWLYLLRDIKKVAGGKK